MSDEKISGNELDKMMFINLVMMLSSSGMQQLGKLMDPAKGKTEVNLEGAQFVIDTLLMLKSKTKSNLDKDEERLITNTIATLQMNYVETTEAEKTKKTEVPPAKKEDEPAAENKQDPKFKKSYGE
jgi:hypothetical protein